MISTDIIGYIVLFIVFCLCIVCAKMGIFREIFDELKEIFSSFKK